MQLGSTSLTTDAAGTVVSELRYTAWGEVRSTSGETPTNYTYTGQYSYAGEFGLMYYNARWYDPYITHFSQPDTIVQNVYDPQSLNRYAYVLNNPIRYNDPTGHRIDDGCRTEGCHLTPYQKTLDAQKLAKLEKQSQKRKCDAGNYEYCSGIDLILKRHEKPVSGIHVGYSGQAGLGLEVGVYHQWDWVIDWKEGNLYKVKTVGYFFYGGTPAGMEGSVYVGTSNVHGMPNDAEDISDFLRGPQTDASVSVNADVGLFAGGGKGVSVDLDESGKPVYIPGAGYMYTTESDLEFGGNAVPNLLDVNGQWGNSNSYDVKKVPLW